MRHLFQRRARAASFAAAHAFALLLAGACVGARAQPAQSPAPSPTPAPRQEASAAGQSTTPRERRAQAYAKLLEGQRYFSAARDGQLTMDGLRQAQRSFQQAAELDPTLSEARTALAEIAFFFLNDLQQAEREAQSALRADPDNVGARRVISRVHTLTSNLAEGRPDPAAAERAVASLREVVRLRPNDAEAWALLGEFHLALGREAEAVEAFRRWAGAPAPLEVRFYQVVTKGRELTPDTAYVRLAETLLQMNRHEEAVSAARQAWEIAPEEQRHLDLLSVASAQLAQVYAEGARYEDAVRVYEELLRARGVGERPLASQRERQFAAHALGGIVELRRQAGQYKEAAAAVERMRGVLGADDPTAALYAVELLRDQGKRAEALEAARAARARHPSALPLLNAEATLLAELGRVDEATSLYRMRLKGTADDYDDYLRIAGLLINAGRGTEAVSAAQKALALVPAGAERPAVQALLVLSSAQDRAGDFKGSEESLRQVLAKDPDNATALNNLGYYLAERNERLTEALAFIERAVRAEPDNASFIDSLGWTYFKLGKLEEAERYLSDAAKRRPNSAAIQEHLGDLFQKRGRPEQARAAWRKALSLSTENGAVSRIRAKLGEPVK